MSRRAVWSLALCAACLVGHSHAQAQCTPADFGKEIIARIAGDKCPKPNEPELEAIIGRIDAAIADDKLVATQRSAALLAELRKLGDAYRQRPSWGASLGRGIDAAILRARSGELPLSGFANIRAPNAPPDPAECSLVAGTRGELDYACFVLQGSALPPPASDGTRVSLHVLEPYEAALAVRALSAAHSAISKLNIPELDKAIERLTQAEQRFDNLRKHGYLQYPWELALDTALAPRARYDACQATDSFCSGETGLDPASLRVIFLHPGVGIAAPGLGFKGKPSWDTAIALSLEAIGFVSYTESFETYWGLSGGAIVSDGDFGDTRFGLFVHATRWVHAGYLLSVLRDATRGDASVFLSIDLGTAFGASFLE
jgi:hypothetical protein